MNWGFLSPLAFLLLNQQCFATLLFGKRSQVKKPPKIVSSNSNTNAQGKKSKNPPPSKPSVLMPRFSSNSDHGLNLAENDMTVLNEDDFTSVDILEGGGVAVTSPKSVTIHQTSSLQSQSQSEDEKKGLEKWENNDQDMSEATKIFTNMNVVTSGGELFRIQASPPKPEIKDNNTTTENSPEQSSCCLCRCKRCKRCKRKANNRASPNQRSTTSASPPSTSRRRASVPASITASQSQEHGLTIIRNFKMLLKKRTLPSSKSVDEMPKKEAEGRASTQPTNVKPESQLKDSKKGPVPAKIFTRFSSSSSKDKKKRQMFGEGAPLEGLPVRDLTYEKPRVDETKPENDDGKTILLIGKQEINTHPNVPEEDSEDTDDNLMENSEGKRRLVVIKQDSESFILMSPSPTQDDPDKKTIITEGKGEQESDHSTDTNSSQIAASRLQSPLVKDEFIPNTPSSLISITRNNGNHGGQSACDYGRGYDIYGALWASSTEPSMSSTDGNNGNKALDGSALSPLFPISEEVIVIDNKRQERVTSPLSAPTPTTVGSENDEKHLSNPDKDANPAST